MKDANGFVPHGKHLIAGDWVPGDQTFLSAPATGTAHSFSLGTPELVDAACQAAEQAFASFSQLSRATRADFLNAIADEIEARGPEITEIGYSETGLPAARLEGERSRTVGQLRLFATHILDPDHFDARHDRAIPDCAHLPRPDLRMVQRPIGPVAVFGASNFPLAFSTAGGDTTSALAAGCSVVVKGHPGHPGTSEIIADAIHAARGRMNLHPGVFSLIHDGGHAMGAALVQHPLITAVGFTGSLAGGRALFDLCAARPTPIPFFGELGSVNPIFVMPGALSARADELAQSWAASLTLGAGQFCTNPGLVFLPAGADADRFVAAATEALAESAPQLMLSDGIAKAYEAGRAQVAGTAGVDQPVRGDIEARSASPSLFVTDATTFRDTPHLSHEVFGPMGIIVMVDTAEDFTALAASLEGQLTATIQMDAPDTDAVRALTPILERKAGRILFNGLPTGVDVADGMVHGGPYPASTNFGATSVGTLAIRRFLRPVCYQDLPSQLAVLP